MKAALVLSVLALAAAALGAPTLSEAEKSVEFAPEVTEEASLRERKSLPVVATAGYGGGFGGGYGGGYGGVAVAPISTGYGHPISTGYGQAGLGLGHGGLALGHGGLALGHGGVAVGGYGGSYGAGIGYGQPSIVLKGPSISLGHYRASEEEAKADKEASKQPANEAKPKASEEKPEETNEEAPSARSYGGYGAVSVGPVAAYGGSGCGYSSPAVYGPSVGVFPNSNVGGCAVPLLLSCSPRVSSGYVIKQHYGGASYGGSSYGGSSYKASEDSNQTQDAASKKEQDPKSQSQKGSQKQ